MPISICDTERIRRVDAVDEVKRALEIAERVPFRFLVQHLGHGRQSMDSRSIDAAFNSLEHLVIFAKERGVTIALENTPNELGSPESLDHLIKETHLRDLKFCFDIGHAHMEEGVEKSFEVMRDRIVTAHIHDNHGDKDEHLLPFEGTIDWDAALQAFAAMPQPPDLVLELKEQAGGKPSLDKVREAFDKLEERLE
jgi:sugar phosphate isomerase/epimerase